MHYNFIISDNKRNKQNWNYINTKYKINTLIIPMQDLLELDNGTYNVVVGNNVNVNTTSIEVTEGATIYKSANSIIIVDKDEISKFEGLGGESISSTHTVGEADFEYRDNVGSITVNTSWGGLSFTKGSASGTYWGVLGTETEKITIESKFSQRGFICYKKENNNYIVNLELDPDFSTYFYKLQNQILSVYQLWNNAVERYLSP